MHHAGVPSEMLPYNIVKNNKSIESIKYYLNTILLWPVYYGNWRCHFKNNTLHLRNFLRLPVIALFFRKLSQLSHNYLNFIFIFLKFRNREMYSPEVSVSSTMWYKLSAPKCRFIFYSAFSLQSTQNLYKQKHFIERWYSCFVLNIFL